MRLLLCAATLAGVVLASPAHAQVPNDSVGVRGLPLIEVPARDSGPTMAVLLSGDGGWASIDRQIAEQLESHGVSVVGLNMKDYLGTERTPAEVSADLARIIRTYRQRWHRDRVIVVGFSRGADIAPFALARFPDSLRAEVKLLALVGLAEEANFKWHWQDVIRDVKRSNDKPVRPELDRLRDVRTICIYGADEKESGCRDTPPEVKRVERPGGHHMDGDYKAVGQLVFDAIPR